MSTLKSLIFQVKNASHDLSGLMPQSVKTVEKSVDMWIDKDKKRSVLQSLNYQKLEKSYVLQHFLLLFVMFLSNILILLHVKMVFIDSGTSSLVQKR